MKESEKKAEAFVDGDEAALRANEGDNQTPPKGGVASEEQIRMRAYELVPRTRWESGRRHGRLVTGGTRVSRARLQSLLEPGPATDLVSVAGGGSRLTARIGGVSYEILKRSGRMDSDRSDGPLIARTTTETQMSHADESEALENGKESHDTKDTTEASAPEDGADAIQPNPPRTTIGGWFTTPKFGAAGSGGLELEPGPERD